MKKLIQISALFILFLNLHLFSQVSQWQVIGNGSGNGDDLISDMIVDASGNVIVCGPVFRSQTNTHDYDIVKYNSAGTLLWAKQWDRGTGGNDIPYALALDGSGNVYVTGESYGGSTGIDWVTLKLNGSTGAILWSVFENGGATLITPNDKPRDIAVSSAGNVYVCGSFSDDAISSGGVNMGVVKYNTNGAPQWIKRYQGAWVDEARQIRLDASENVYFTGYSITNNLIPPGCIYLTFKLNSSGTQQWYSGYLGFSANHFNEPFDMEVDASGNVYVTGASQSQANAFFDIVTVKYAGTNGSQVWAARYDPLTALDCVPSDLTIDASGNIYVTGYHSYTATGKDLVALKYNGSTGQNLYTYSYNYSGNGGNHDDAGNFIAVDNLGNAYITGFVTGTVGKDIATFILNPSGNNTWSNAYYGPVAGDDFGFRVAVDASRNFVIAGSTYQGSTPKMDWFIRKFAVPTAINNNSNIIPSEFNLYENYPNPFNPSTVIKFDIPFSTSASISVFDINGKQVSDLSGGYSRFEAGSYEINFNAGQLSSGVYFLKFSSANYNKIIKMIYCK